jgi:hypothetical protein
MALRGSCGKELFVHILLSILLAIQEFALFYEAFQIFLTLIVIELVVVTYSAKGWVIK